MKRPNNPFIGTNYIGKEEQKAVKEVLKSKSIPIRSKIMHNALPSTRDCIKRPASNIAIKKAISIIQL